MLQVAADKLHPGQSADIDASRVAVLPAERNGLAVDMNQTRVVDGRSRHVGAQIFERGGTGAGGLDVHAPVQGPHVGGGLPPMDIEAKARPPKAEVRQWVRAQQARRLFLERP